MPTVLIFWLCAWLQWPPGLGEVSGLKWPSTHLQPPGAIPHIHEVPSLTLQPVRPCLALRLSNGAGLGLLLPAELMTQGKGHKAETCIPNLYYTFCARQHRFPCIFQPRNVRQAPRIDLSVVILTLQLITPWHILSSELIIINILCLITYK